LETIQKGTVSPKITNVSLQLQYKKQNKAYECMPFTNMDHWSQ